MTAPGNDLLFLVLTLSILLSSAYAVGRIHQWHKYSLERDEAYRIGYDKASLSIIRLMADQTPLGVAESATVTPLAALPHARRNGRHTRARRLSTGQPQPLQREQCDRIGT
jgi:hypothetical protein